jgi:uncharacterized integral membrane protein
MGMLLRLIIGVPLLVLLVLFALSNPIPVRLTLWPTDFAVEVPLSLAILTLTGAAFVIGALLVWINELGQRRRARRAEHMVRLLEAQVEELKARLHAQPANG